MVRSMSALVDMARSVCGIIFFSEKCVDMIEIVAIRGLLNVFPYFAASVLGKDGNM